MTPRELAVHLPVSQKVLREWLRARHPQHPPYERWHLSAWDVLRAVNHFGLVGWSKP